MPLIVGKNTKSHISEEFKTLRTNIQFSSFEKDLKTILITSPASLEGKSTIAANLALTMAESDKSVLLIDCDLRRPSIHKKFKIPNEVGLSNFLIGGFELKEVMTQYNRSLFVITSGLIPPNPSELLALKKMKDLLKMLNEMFDYIILDTPPVIAVTDAQILSSMVDGVILVASFNKTSKESLVKTKELLNNVRANIVGVVMNKMGEEYKGKYCY